MTTEKAQLIWSCFTDFYGQCLNNAVGVFDRHAYTRSRGEVRPTHCRISLLCPPSSHFTPGGHNTIHFFLEKEKNPRPLHQSMHADILLNKNVTHGAIHIALCACTLSNFSFYVVIHVLFTSWRSKYKSHGHLIW